MKNKSNPKTVKPELTGKVTLERKINPISGKERYFEKCEREEYESLLSAGNKAQIEKLKANSHKSGMDNLDPCYGYDCLEKEMEELQNELLLYPLSEDKKESWKAIRREAADIANFAYMIILKCDKELK